jgi:hypothetical protein
MSVSQTDRGHSCFPEATNHGELFGFERTATLSSCAANTIAEAAVRFGQSMT